MRACVRVATGESARQLSGSWSPYTWHRNSCCGGAHAHDGHGCDVPGCTHGSCGAGADPAAGAGVGDYVDGEVGVVDYRQYSPRDPAPSSSVPCLSLSLFLSHRNTPC